MTDSQIIHLTYISRDAIANFRKLNLSDEQISALSANACITVIGGIVYEGEDVDSIRLFKSKSLAEKYIVDLLSGESPYTYVQVQIQEIVVGVSYD